MLPCNVCQPPQRCVTRWPSYLNCFAVMADTLVITTWPGYLPHVSLRVYRGTCCSKWYHVWWIYLSKQVSRADNSEWFLSYIHGWYLLFFTQLYISIKYKVDYLLISSNICKKYKSRISYIRLFNKLDTRFPWHLLSAGCRVLQLSFTLTKSHIT